MGAVGIGHRDESIGDRRQHAIQAADAIGPTRAVERGENDGHADAPSREATPKHLVAGADRDDSVDLSIAQQLCESRPNAQVVLVRQQVVVNRNLGSQHLTERATLFEAANLRSKILAIEPTHQVDEQCFGAADRHTRE